MRGRPITCSAVKAVILAGGFGSRLSEETALRPKPMVEIGGKPMLWHIMKIYAAHGIEEFVICLGYKGYLIKEYFANYYLHTCDVSFDLAKRRHGGPSLRDRALAGDARGHRREDDDRRAPEARARVPGRRGLLLHLRRRPGGRRHHRADRLPPRAGDARDRHGGAAARALRRAGARRATGCAAFEEKPRGDGGWTNGGFFVLSPGVGRYIDGDDTVWEQEPCERSRARASSRATATRASGRRWTRCATATTSRSCGARARLHGGRGPRRDGCGRSSAPGPSTRLLARTARAAHRPHRLQGRLAGAVAAVPRGARDRASRSTVPTRAVAVRAGARGRGHGRASRATSATTQAVAAARRGGRARRSSSTWPRSRSCAARSPSRARRSRPT